MGVTYAAEISHWTKVLRETAGVQGPIIVWGMNLFSVIGDPPPPTGRCSNDNEYDPSKPTRLFTSRKPEGSVDPDSI